MPKGQLSLARELLDVFTFQPALRVLQHPHKHSHSLQLAIHTQLAHHYIQSALGMIGLFFPRGFIQSTVQPHHSTEMALERATNHINSM